MLGLEVQVGEKVMIQCPDGVLIDIMVAEVRGRRQSVKLSFDAPYPAYKIDREAVYLDKQRTAGERR